MKSAKNYFQQHYHFFIAVFIGLVGAFILFPTLFDMGIYPLRNGDNDLDASWVLTLNYANIKNLKWGVEYAFTYGPLSYLALRVGWGADKYSFLLFDFFYFINVFALLYLNYLKSKNKIIFSLIALIVILFTPTYNGGDSSLVLFILLLFWIRQILDSPKFLFYIFAIVLIAVLFFIKFNTGLTSFIVYYIAIGYVIYSKKGKLLPSIFFAIVPIILIVIGCEIFNVNLFKYVISGFHLVSGYNDIMYIDNPDVNNMKNFAIAYVIIAAVFLILKRKKEKGEWLKTSIIIFLFAFAWFILFKQSFVRADIYHAVGFYKYAPMLLLCFYDFSNLEHKSYYNLMVAAVLIIFAYPCLKIEGFTLQSLTEKCNKKEYFKAFSEFTSTSGMHLTPPINPFPERIINKVGSETVDVYPWNSQMLLENGLNYTPRPMMQSYTVYTKELEEMNFNFYNSSKGPKYVFYEYKTVDERYPLFDESKVNLVLLKNYTIADSFLHNDKKILLLEKKETAKPIRFEFVKQYAMMINSPLIPKSGIYYEVSIYHTIKGKIASIINHSPKLTLSIRATTQMQDFKISKGLLETGIFSDKFMTTTDDFNETIEQDSIKNKKVNSYVILPKKLSYFKDKIRIKEYKIIQ